MFDMLPPADLEPLDRLQQRRQTFVAGREPGHQGQSDHAAYILAEG
jgi:hypothetical protein